MKQILQYYGNDRTKYSPHYKYLLLICIIIPFGALLTFNQYSPINLYLNKIIFTKRINSIIDSLNQAIKKNKLITNEPLQNQCQYLLDYRPTLQIENQYINQINQQLSRNQINNLCGSMLSINNPTDIFIITVLTINSDQQLSKMLDTVQQKINLYAKYKVTIQIQEMNTMVLPKHLRQKIKQQIYQDLIAENFLQTRYMKNCLYTYKSCQNRLIILKQNSSAQDDTYSQFQGVYFTASKNIDQMILNILQIDYFSETQHTMKNWQKYEIMKRLYHLKKQLVYLCEYLWADRSLLAQDSHNFLSDYLSSVQLYLKNINNSSQIQYPQAPTINQQLNSIDIFPTQYKIGILMPLVVSFVIFPLMNLLKK